MPIYNDISILRKAVGAIINSLGEDVLSFPDGCYNKAPLLPRFRKVEEKFGFAMQLTLGRWFIHWSKYDNVPAVTRMKHLTR